MRKQCRRAAPRYAGVWPPSGAKGLCHPQYLYRKGIRDHLEITNALRGDIRAATQSARGYATRISILDFLGAGIRIDLGCHHWPTCDRFSIESIRSITDSPHVDLFPSLLTEGSRLKTCATLDYHRAASHHHVQHCIPNRMPKCPMLIRYCQCNPASDAADTETLQKFSIRAI